MSRFISDEASNDLINMAVTSGVLSEDNFQKVKSLHEESGQSIVSILFERSLMDEFSLAKFVADSYALNFMEVHPDTISSIAESKLTHEYMRINNVFAFEIDGSTLKVAICDQSKLGLEKNISVITGMRIEMVLRLF